MAVTIKDVAAAAGVSPSTVSRTCKDSPSISRDTKERVRRIMAEGGRPHCCGVIPTPAVALLTVQNELDGGIVISASHNPPEFNGIKFFSRKGMKLPDAVEEEISAWVMSEEAMAADTLPTGAGVGHIIKMKDARKAYVDHAIDTLDGLRLDGLVVAVDCGHGASCQTTPAALQRLGATVHAINQRLAAEI